MIVREASLQFRVVREGDIEALGTPERIADYVCDMFDEDPTIEIFVVIPVSSKHHPYGRILISKGTAQNTLVNAREVLRPCILANATGFFCAHNHPSGDSSPSRADIHVTRQLREAGKLMGIPMLDHIIVGDPGTPIYSFNEAGLV